MDLLSERPQEANTILSQLRHWKKKHMIIFLEEFIQNNIPIKNPNKNERILG